MTDAACPDCPLEDPDHAEIADVLREDDLDVFARADLAADAIDLAEAEARARKPRRRVLQPLLTAAAVVVVGVGLWAATGGRPPAGDPEEGGEDVEASAGGVAAERAANEAFLARPEIQARLAKVPTGQWVGIQHGKTMLVADALGALDLQLKRAELPDPLKKGAEFRWPIARHRFTFQRGSAGRKAHKTNFGTPPFVGADFMARVPLGIERVGGGGTRYVIDDPERGRLKLDVPYREGKGAELALHVGEPAGMATVPLLVGYSTGSAAPLVLPAGMGFPRFEIPGTATLEGGSDHPGTFRRCMASISIPTLGIRETYVEAIGNRASPEQADGTLRLGGRVWGPQSTKLFEEARRQGKPVLLLLRRRWARGYPGNPFAGLPAERVTRALAPFVLAWREPGKSSAWVGSGNDVPPMDAALVVIDPSDRLRTMRQLIVRPWTPREHVWALLSAGLREIKAQGAHRETVAKNETTAIDVLWHIAYGQGSMKKQVNIDADGNGVGEYGTLLELTGGAAGRMRAKLKPVLLPITFKPAPGQHDLVLEGYRFRLFFPAKGSGAITRPGPNSLNVHVPKAEMTWWAYGWPERLGETGERTFYVDQRGVIWGTGRKEAVYEGRAAAPLFDAAFASRDRVPGGVSPALVSSDGNQWSEVRRVKRR